MKNTPFIMMISDQYAVCILGFALAFVIQWKYTLLARKHIPLRQFTSEKLTLATAALHISAIALSFIVGHYALPETVRKGIAGTLLFFLGLYAAQCVTLSFKNTQDKEQGTAAQALSPAQVRRALSPGAPSADTMKVLATLWHYQRQAFGNDTTKRWTFVVHPVSSDYPGFLAGLSEAVNRG